MKNGTFLHEPLKAFLDAKVIHAIHIFHLSYTVLRSLRFLDYEKGSYTLRFIRIRLRKRWHGRCTRIRLSPISTKLGAQSVHMKQAQAWFFLCSEFAYAATCEDLLAYRFTNLGNQFL